MDKTESRLSSVIDNVKHPLESEAYRLKCKKILDKEGVLVLKELLQLYCSKVSSKKCGTRKKNIKLSILDFSLAYDNVLI